MKTGLAINKVVLEVYELDDKAKDDEYYPRVFQFAEDENAVSIRQSKWPINTDCDRQVSIGPSSLWTEIDKIVRDLEDFVKSSLDAAPKLSKSQYYICYCDNGYMYLGPKWIKGFNWITYIPHNRHIIVGHHYENNNIEDEIKKGLQDGTVIPISEAYFNFIIDSLAKRIRLIKEVVIALFNPY